MYHYFVDLTFGAINKVTYWIPKEEISDFVFS